VHAKLRYAIQYPWTEIEPLRVGDVPTGLGTPDCFVTVEDDRGPRLRVDVYGSGGAFSEVQVWCGLIVIGWGEHLYLVRPEGGAVTTVNLGSYFGHLYPAGGYLLVASGERLIRLRPNGSLLWTSDRLGIDGVIVHAVEEGIIRGDGEWDPPGGWRPFRLSLETGQPS
jgi:hypothetical protein